MLPTSLRPPSHARGATRSTLQLGLLLSALLLVTRAPGASAQAPFVCPATTLVAPHVTALGAPLPAFDLAACNASAARSAYAVGAAYSTPSAGPSGQLTIGSGTSLNATNLTVIGQVNCTLSDGSNTTCLSVRSFAVPDHPAGPWCSGGNWQNTVVNYSAIAANCNCQRNACNSTCSDMCLECPLASPGTTYHIPLVPVPAAATAPAEGDNNHGNGIALNGVPLTHADPLALLASSNNPAPLDWYGGHVTLQYVYHYHAVPSYRFSCAAGWDSYAHVWAPSAPNGQHSQQIGWALDGYPVFGLYSTSGLVPSVGGSAPSDTDACYGHNHTPFGYHYHSRDIHDGWTHAFLGCFKGKRAVQPFDSAAGPGGPAGGPGAGAAAVTCPAGTVWSVGFGSTQRCCGDGVCDGPETAASCAVDCAGGGASPLGPSPPIPPTVLPGASAGTIACPAGTVVSGSTQRCCGDSVCDGPETAANCAADCAGVGSSSLGPSPPITLPGTRAIACPAGTVRSGSTQRCCGDSVCDSPETAVNCAADCAGAGGSSLSPSPSTALPGARAGTVACPAGTVRSGSTQRCCGDGVCDGPETAANCAADCTGAGGSTLQPGRRELRERG